MTARWLTGLFASLLWPVTIYAQSPSNASSPATPAPGSSAAPPPSTTTAASTSTPTSTTAVASTSAVVAEPREPERTAHNSLYVELLGSGLLYSINYDRMLSEHFSIRAGIGYFGLSASSGSTSASVGFTMIPIVANYLAGARAHKFELGLGVVPVIVSGSASDDGIGKVSGSATGVIGTGVIGYRFAPLEGGFNFRVGLTPVFGSWGFLPWPGISFGYGF